MSRQFIVIKGATIPAIILVSLFVPLVWSVLIGYELNNSSLLSADKIFRIGTIALSFYFVAAGIAANRLKYSSRLLHFLLPLVGLLFIHLIHLLTTSDAGGEWKDAATKEIARLIGAMVIMLAIILHSRSFGINIRLIVLASAALGMMASLGAIYYSITTELEKSWRMVGQFARAGDQIVDPNLLGAFFVYCTIVSAVGIIIIPGRIKKAYFFVGALLAIGGRFFTFSTGSLLNLIVSFTVLLLLLSMRNARLFRRFFVGGIILALGIIIYLAKSELGSALMYRVLLSDDYVMQASIGSRLRQYQDISGAFLAHPEYSLFGFGNVLTPQLMETPIQLHNSFFRAFAGSGLVGLLMYVYVVYASFIALKRGLSSTNFELKIFSAGLLSLFVGWLLQAQTLPADTSILSLFYFATAAGLYDHRSMSNQNNKAFTPVHRFIDHDK